jgi:hypothetical protein
MASTLKAVESRAVALAAEDFSHPELLVPLPGRTGHALQATIDSLAARIGEREQQRQLLHDAATHDQLTGLFNRAAVIEYLTNDVARRREAGETVGVPSSISMGSSCSTTPTATRSATPRSCSRRGARRGHRHVRRGRPGGR